MVTKRLTLKKPDEVTEAQLAEVYMILVEGRGEPKNFHFDYEIAFGEANRLAEKETPKLVSLLKVMSCFQGKVKIEEVGLPKPSITN